MEELINDPIRADELMKFEKKYKSEEAVGKPDKLTTFEYSWCLIRSRYKEDWKRGLNLLEDLFKTGNTHEQRDYLFYMSIGHYKLKEYERALKLCNAILHVEETNHQAKDLKRLIEKTMKKDGIIGMAVVGGAGLVVGIGVAALATIGILASKK